jgi:hypothetical protein
MPKVTSPPTEVLHAIQRKATQVRDAAALLTQRIEQFELYLSQLNGRVETYTWAVHPNSNPQFPLELGLGLIRSAKSWNLIWTTLAPGQDPAELDWSLLKKASLKIKIAGTRMFPDLLDAIEKSQDSLVKNIQQAVADYDAFAATLKPKPDEGHPAPFVKGFVPHTPAPDALDDAAEIEPPPQKPHASEAKKLTEEPHLSEPTVKQTLDLLDSAAAPKKPPLPRARSTPRSGGLK